MITANVEPKTLGDKAIDDVKRIIMGSSTVGEKLAVLLFGELLGKNGDLANEILNQLRNDFGKIDTDQDETGIYLKGLIQGLSLVA